MNTLACIIVGLGCYSYGEPHAPLTIGLLMMDSPSHDVRWIEFNTGGEGVTIYSAQDV